MLLQGAGAAPEPGWGWQLRTVVVLRRERCHRRDTVITIFSRVNPWEITLWEGRSLQAKTHAETAQNWALQRTVIYFKNGNHSLLQTDSTQAL